MLVDIIDVIEELNSSEVFMLILSVEIGKRSFVKISWERESG